MEFESLNGHDDDADAENGASHLEENRKILVNDEINMPFTASVGHKHEYEESFQEETVSLMKMIKTRKTEDDREAMRGQTVLDRVGFWSRKRKHEYNERDGMSRHHDWAKKLSKPRMGMVADLEEERKGVKTKVMTLIKDCNRNTISKARRVTSLDTPGDGGALIFKVVNDQAIVRRTIKNRESSSSSDSSEEDMSVPEYSHQSRKFHIKAKESSDSEDDCIIIKRPEQSPSAALAVDNEMDVDAEEESAQLHETTTEAPREDEDEEMEAIETEEKTNNSVLEKIAALKEIDRKLLDIERAKGRRLKAGMKMQQIKMKARSRSRKETESSSSESSSSSSDSSSDSSGSDDSDQEEQRLRHLAIKSSGTNTLYKRKLEDKSKCDLRDKLKHYLSKAKERRRRKKRS